MEKNKRKYVNKNIEYKPIMGIIKKSLDFAKSVKDDPDEVKLWEAYLESLGKDSTIKKLKKTT